MAVNLSIPTLTKYLKSALITVLIGLGIIICYIIYLAQDLPSLDQLENYDPDLVTRIYSADGEILDELFLEKRIFVSLDQIPNNMKNAVISSEDRRFYNHWGIDSRSIIRAIVVNIIRYDIPISIISIHENPARMLIMKIICDNINIAYNFHNLFL